MDDVMASFFFAKSTTIALGTRLSCIVQTLSFSTSMFPSTSSHQDVVATIK